MRRYLFIALLVLVVAVALNDGGRYFNAYNDLNSTTDQILSWASLNASHQPPDAVAAELDRQAAAGGIRVTQYALEPDVFHVWAEADVKGTWIIGPYMAMANGTPFKEAWGTSRDFVLRKDATAAYR